MKVTVVPAQVTTIEDRVVGNLGISQLLLLTLPVFGGSAVFIVLPPFYHAAVYKLVLLVLACLVCGVMAIRIRGQLVLQRLLVLMCYVSRARYYVYDKRCLHGRSMYQHSESAEPVAEPLLSGRKLRPATKLSVMDAIKLQHVIDNPAAQVQFETTKRGGLYVRITEVKPEV